MQCVYFLVYPNNITIGWRSLFVPTSLCYNFWLLTLHTYSITWLGKPYAFMHGKIMLTLYCNPNHQNAIFYLHLIYLLILEWLEWSAIVRRLTKSFRTHLRCYLGKFTLCINPNLFWKSSHTLNIFTFVNIYNCNSIGWRFLCLWRSWDSRLWSPSTWVEASWQRMTVWVQQPMWQQQTPQTMGQLPTNYYLVALISFPSPMFQTSLWGW